MAHQGGQESQPGYMDGVCVKISEKYKPPPRINLAISYSQRLSLNQQLQDNMQLYNFSLETNIQDCMKDLKNTRKAVFDNKRDKLDKIKAVRKKRAEELEASKALETSDVDDSEIKSVPSCTCESSRVVTTDILYPTYSHILTPTPLTNNRTSQNYAITNCTTTDKSPFNIADFEEDTSSPFDNMELKTINDIEELAQVLKKDKSYNQVYTNYVPLPTTSGPSNYTADTSSSTYTYNIPQGSTTSVCQPINTTMYSNLNGFYFSPIYTNYSHGSSTKPIKSDSLKLKLSQKNNSDISKKLHDAHIPDKPKDAKENAKSEVDDIYELLPKNLQQLSQNISLMGFPLPRVARACQALGDNQKRVVEHLLVMSELLDLGFSEKDVSSALIQCNNDRDRALDILIM